MDTLHLVPHAVGSFIGTIITWLSALVLFHVYRRARSERRAAAATLYVAIALTLWGAHSALVIFWFVLHTVWSAHLLLLQPVILIAALAFLMQFAYAFRDNPFHHRESRIAAYAMAALWTGVTLFILFQLVMHGEAYSVPLHVIEFIYPVAIVWVIAVFVRKWFRTWQGDNLYFAGLNVLLLVPGITYMLVLLYLFPLHLQAYVHDAVLCLYPPALAMLYIYFADERLSVGIKFVGASLITVLAVLGLAALTFYAPSAMQRESGIVAPHREAIHFEPVAETGDYRVGPLSYQFHEFVGVRLPIGDRQHIALPMGFTFPFFGRGWDTLFVSDDGLVTFGEPPCRSPTTRCFYSTRAAIAPLYADFNPAYGDGVFYRRETDRLIITWLNVPVVQEPRRRATFQLVLHRSGSFTFIYEDVDIVFDEVLRGIHPGGDPVYTAINFSADLPFTISASPALVEDYALLYRRFSAGRVAWLYVTISLFAFLIPPIFMLIARISVLAPIRDLQTAAEQINRHDFNVDLRKRRSKDQIGDLRNAFAQMAHELKRYAIEMNDLVAERTAQLADEKLKVETQARALQEANAQLARANGNLEQAKQELEAKNQKLEDAKGARESAKQELEDKNRHLQDAMRSLEEARRELETQNRSLEEAKAKVEEASAAKSRFLANISHEFRNPLTCIMGPLDDALDGNGTLAGPAARPKLTMMKNESLRLLSRINKLLAVSKIEASSEQMNARPADVVSFLRRLCLDYSSVAERQKLTFHFESDAESCTLYFDPDKLETIIRNLLGNAFKFTPSGERVLLSVTASTPDSTSNGAVRIKVKNTGTRISQAVLPFIFQPFYQGDNTSTREHEGTGVGLALVKGYVEQHRGHVEADSDALGTMFTVTLPMGRDHLSESEVLTEEVLQSPDLGSDDRNIAWEVVPHDDDLETPPRSAEDAPSDAPTVLIVEDNENVRAYIRMNLHAQYRLTEAADGEEGWQRARELKPDLIITDVMMPGMDGFELCRRLKSDPDLDHIPVIMLTALATPEHREKGFESRANDYLFKPFDAHELHVRMRNLIEDRRRMAARNARHITFLLGKDILTVTAQHVEFFRKVVEITNDMINNAPHALTAGELEARIAEEALLKDGSAEVSGEVSQRTARRRTRDVTGMGTGEFLTAMRLLYARQLLESQLRAREADPRRELQPEAVARKVGWNSYPVFKKKFCDHFGIVPDDLERMYQAKKLLDMGTAAEDVAEVLGYDHVDSLKEIFRQIFRNWPGDGPETDSAKSVAEPAAG